MGTRFRSVPLSSSFISPTSPVRRKPTTLSITQTIVQDKPISPRQDDQEVLAALPSPEQVQELLLLYQYSIHMLGSQRPDQVIQISLELLRERTKAAVVGFLWGR